MTSKILHRLRTLPLRSRLALLSAAAVAFAVAAVSVACWFTVRSKLYEEIDQDLRSASQPQNARDVQAVTSNCTTDDSDSDDDAGIGPKTQAYVQLVDTDGTVCLSGRSAGTVEATDSDTAVAGLVDSGAELDRDTGTLRNGVDSEGNPVRVLTTPLMIESPGENPVYVKDQALMIAYPLADTQATLTYLAWLLLGLSGLGVVGAGAAGLWIARAGLRPVDDLADTVEHVARTEDLTVRIPVTGDDEIARLSESFNSMTAALAASRDLQQQLIADAGHELRTPLTSMRTNIELLARSESTGRAIPPADKKALMDSVKAQMTELAALIGDLQELSRTGPGSSAQLQVVAVHEIARSALQRARLRAAGQEIEARLAPWYARSEPAALERALINLMDNAIKFGPPGRPVEVTLDRGVLTVRDHGPGVPADELPHVFDRFWRSPSARALPGSGLGLSIVARTAEQSGGDVALRPAADGRGGTEAVLRLPGAPTPPPEEEPATSPQ